VVLNGGVTGLDAADRHLAHVDGVMLGRAAYQTPFLLAEADRRYFGSRAAPMDRHGAVEAMAGYIDAELAAGTPLAAMMRHMLGLFQGVPGARAWRRHLSEHAHRPGAGLDVLRQALASVPRGIPAAAE
jgi:tRNA-dihydrouridine synthase A